MAEQGYYYETSNLIVICVDREKNEDYSGRLYDCCSGEPVGFENVLQMIKRMEELYDVLDYPQASTVGRCFIEKRKRIRREVTRVTDRTRILRQKGDLGTFVVRVQYRQNATWQGQVTWAERQETQSFRSALELLKLIDNALDAEEDNVNDDIDVSSHRAEAEIPRCVGEYEAGGGSLAAGGDKK